jgi:hypothetical protein
MGNYDAAFREVGSLPGRTEGGCARALPRAQTRTQQPSVAAGGGPCGRVEHEEQCNAPHSHFSV